MYIYDSSKKTKVLFEPIVKNEVSMYVCGPTVYDDAHLGHARSAIAFDLLRRVLIALGYKVTFVKNFTDIDDKIINKLNSTDMDLTTLTNHYITRYKNEMQALHVNDADIEPKATQSLPYIISFIQTLLDKSFAYKLEDGVYFDTSKDEKYLSLSSRSIDDAKARVQNNEEKKDPKDFALWKNVKDDELGFSSPFGKGRPGWHIECSAMIFHFLAHKNEKYQIDIHGGGADLLFPHHENEAAQTRCGCGQNLAKYWLHNGFVAINGEKMSKSLGNSFFLKDALLQNDGEILRFYLLSTHYRADFNFSHADLSVSKKRLDKLYRLKKRLKTPKPFQVDEAFKARILDALQDDLNISKALSILDDMIVKSNEMLDFDMKNKTLHYQIHANLEFVKQLLGIGFIDVTKYFQLGFSDEMIQKINDLMQKRNEAKKNKDYKKADEIRQILFDLHVNIMDTSEGSIWEGFEA